MTRLLVLISALALAGVVVASAPPTAEQLARAKYLSARGCKPCHNTTSQGRMYKIWEASAHAAAYDTLGTPRGIQVGSEHGVTDPQNDEKCLRCHATASGVPDARRSRRVSESNGVTCESCHGAGQYYKAKKVMCRITAGTVDPASVAMIAADEATCVRCHNDQSPTWPGSFNYEEMAAKIAHPLPAARKQKITDEGCD